MITNRPIEMTISDIAECQLKINYLQEYFKSDNINDFEIKYNEYRDIYARLVELGQELVYAADKKCEYMFKV